MIDGYKELTPVIYGENAIKYLYTEQKKAEGEICFLLHWHDRMELTYVTEGTLRQSRQCARSWITVSTDMSLPVRKRMPKENRRSSK